jgi:hypothetical protein
MSPAVSAFVTGFEPFPDTKEVGGFTGAFLNECNQSFKTGAGEGEREIPELYLSQS